MRLEVEKIEAELKAEDARKAAENKQARMAEEEARKLAAEAEKLARAEEARNIAEAKKVEDARKTAEAQLARIQAEEARKLADAAAEEVRKFGEAGASERQASSSTAIPENKAPLDGPPSDEAQRNDAAGTNPRQSQDKSATPVETSPSSDSVQASEPSLGAQLPSEPARASWATYRNARFGFGVSYPADVFALVKGEVNEHVQALVSRDGRAQFRIWAAPNSGGVTINDYRRAVIAARYANAIFDYTPRRSFWFVLSGISGGEIFYERVTLSCDRKSLHAWQLRYPVSERVFYDRIVEAIHRGYWHSNGPGARCKKPA